MFIYAAAELLVPSGQLSIMFISLKEVLSLLEAFKLALSLLLVLLRAFLNHGIPQPTLSHTDVHTILCVLM